jgi:hypothetical protein
MHGSTRCTVFLTGKSPALQQLPQQLCSHDVQECMIELSRVCLTNDVQQQASTHTDPAAGYHTVLSQQQAQHLLQALTCKTSHPAVAKPSGVSAPCSASCCGTNYSHPATPTYTAVAPVQQHRGAAAQKMPAGAHALQRAVLCLTWLPCGTERAHPWSGTPCAPAATRSKEVFQHR